MKTTWIVAADKSRARIFEVQGVAQNFHEVQDFVNPAGEMSPQDLQSDAKGYFHGNSHGQRGGDAEPKIDAVMHQTEMFSKALGGYLDRACEAHKFDRLCLIAYPKFLGLLRQNLSKEAQKLVEDEVAKDISWFDEREVAEYVKTRLH